MSTLATHTETATEHSWELRLEEFEDGHVVRQFECLDCGVVRYE